MNDKYYKILRFDGKEQYSEKKSKKNIKEYLNKYIDEEINEILFIVPVEKSKKFTNNYSPIIVSEFNYLVFKRQVIIWSIMDLSRLVKSS